jgi:hypothetical protein
MPIKIGIHLISSEFPMDPVFQRGDEGGGSIAR